MKTNLIEITVSGRTGSGKSEVLNVIRNALFDFYGRGEGRIRVAGINEIDAIEEAKITGQTAKKNNTVFVLYEQNVTGEIKIHD